MGIPNRPCLTGDEEFAEVLQREFTEEELGIVDLVIEGPNDSETKGQSYFFQNIDKFRKGDREVSLSRELLEILIIVAKTGQRVIGCVVDGVYVEASLEILGTKEQLSREREKIRRQIVLTVSRDSSWRARLSRGKIKSESKTEVRRTALSKRGPDMFSGGLKVMRNDKRKPRENLPAAMRDRVTTGGSPQYSHMNKGQIYDSLDAFRMAYERIAKKLGLIN